MLCGPFCKPAGRFAKPSYMIDKTRRACDGFHHTLSLDVAAGRTGVSNAHHPLSLRQAAGTRFLAATLVGVVGVLGGAVCRGLATGAIRTGAVGAAPVGAAAACAASVVAA